MTVATFKAAAPTTSTTIDCEQRITRMGLDPKECIRTWTLPTSDVRCGVCDRLMFNADAIGYGMLCIECGRV